MPYHIDEANSELAFEVREGNKLVIKIKSNIFSDSLELYLIKVGDNTEPTDKNVFSSLRVLKEIENLHDTILKEINSVTSGFWELKQDSQGNEYIATKYNVLTEGGLTTYGLGEQKLGTIYDGLPIDNDTIYWEEVEGSRVLKAKGSGGGEAGSVQWGNISGKPTWIEDTKPTYNWYEIQGEKPFYTKEEVAAKFVTIDTEQDITALKHFTAGLSVGESKKKIYEENGVVYIDADVAVTGAMTFYASAGRSVSTIMDGVTVDEETITKGADNVLRIKNAGAGSSFDENAMWSALSGSSDNQINKSHLTTALDGYATESWVTGKGYATESWVTSKNYATTEALNAVSNKLNDFLEGSDADTIINKWKELEAFLSGMAETDNLAEILKTKADRSYVDSTFVTLATKQTITGEKTFSSVLNTAAIKASGAITAPSLAASDYVTIAGIKLRKLEDGALMLEGNLALTGALTMYATGSQEFDTIYDGLPIDNDTIYWYEEDGSKVLKAKEGSGSNFDKSAMWNALAGETTEQINKSHLTTALTGYATESWVSGKNYAVKATTLAGYGITDGINAVSVTGTGNAVTAASISGHILTLTKGSTFSLSGHKHAWADITSGKPSTLSGYGITDAYTKTDSDNRYINASGDTMTGDLYFNNSSYPFFNKSNSYAFYNTSINLESWSSNYFYPVKITSNTPSFPLCTVSISSTSGSASLPLNNNSIRFMVRSGGWSDIGKRLIVLDHWAYSSSEITIYAIYLGEEEGDCVVYLRGGVNYTVSVFGRDWISSSDTVLTNGNEKYPKIDLSGNPTDGRSFAKCYRAWVHSNGYGLGLQAENSDKLGGVSSEYFMRTKSQEGYYGMVLPDGSDNNWIRTTNSGIIPYSSTIKSSLGTGQWQFGQAYIETVYTITTKASDWFRSTGNTGWVNETYGGGWYMTDSAWIRAYANKSIAGYNIQGSGKVSANMGMFVYGMYGSSWGSGDGAYGVAVPYNDSQTTLLLAYNGTNDNVTGSDRYFSIEVLNNNNRNVRMIVQGQHLIELLPSKVTIFKDLLVEGGGTFYSSDIRYKSIIQQTKLSLSDIVKAPSFVYHWNKEGMKCDRLNLGGSAQYTQTILPWAVEENDNFLSMDYATVAYTFAVHTARHLLTYETRTDKKIKKLEREIKILKRELKKLGYEEASIVDDQSV